MQRSLAQKDFDLVIAIGFAQVEALKKLPLNFQRKNFVWWMVKSTHRM